MPTEVQNPAIVASEQALAELRECIDQKQSFVLEAGAGAGKTYSLVHVLRELIEKYGKAYARNGQRIACITFTNVAKDEIVSRTDGDPIIQCDTIHGFCWSMIAPFQKRLLEEVLKLPAWQERLAAHEGELPRAVKYDFGFRSIGEQAFSLGHDDVIPIMVTLLTSAKFRDLFTSRYPIVLIDEYQDSNAAWIEAIKTHYLGQENAPLFGFFGDHWQKIYDEGCGAIDHPALRRIGKHANFRSVHTIVESLNRMRPHLTQFAEDPHSEGEVTILQTNLWNVARQTGAHWGGDLEEPEARAAFNGARVLLEAQGWNFGVETTKVLMLTHRALAREQGYASLPGIFRYNESFSKKENKLIEFLIDSIEPAYEAFIAKQYGSMFHALGRKAPMIRTQADKSRWAEAMKQIGAIRATGTVGDLVTQLRATQMPRLPDAVELMESTLDRARQQETGEDASRSVEELDAFHAVSYSEVIALRSYVNGYSPFETNHGVKGAEFENVLVVVGRGWSKYNFDEMLQQAGTPVTGPRNQNKFEQNRNLFYVACSRPKKRLAVLFTQRLSQPAMQTLSRWFGAESVRDLPRSS